MQTYLSGFKGPSVIQRVSRSLALFRAKSVDIKIENNYSNQNFGHIQVMMLLMKYIYIFKNL